MGRFGIRGERGRAPDCFKARILGDRIGCAYGGDFEELARVGLQVKARSFDLIYCCLYVCT